MEESRGPESPCLVVCLGKCFEQITSDSLSLQLEPPVRRGGNKKKDAVAHRVWLRCPKWHRAAECFKPAPSGGAIPHHVASRAETTSCFC